MKVIAKVQFNNSVAIVVNKRPTLVYRRVGRNVIYGTDGLFYQCYKYEKPSKNWKAFAGRKFEITLEDGEIVKCKGQWWDAGHIIVEKALGVKFQPVTCSALSDLERAHPNLRSLVQRVDVMRWGHAMIRPRPGFFWGPERRAAAQPRDGIHFAHADLSGLPLFEEAFYHGTRAAEAVLRERQEREEVQG